MKRESWNENWTVSRRIVTGAVPECGDEEGVRTVNLPYDAMVHEVRTPKTKNLHQTGFYPGGAYTYEKRFYAEKEWENENIIFEFEGVFPSGRVFINGEYAGGCWDGYTNFYIYANKYLNYGKENVLRVLVDNSQEENSRWYSGSGIYRSVNLIRGGHVHIALDGIKICTKEVSTSVATIQIDVAIENELPEKKQLWICTSIVDADGIIKENGKRRITVPGGEAICSRQRVTLAQPLLWSCDNPYLHHCMINIMEGDEVLDSGEVSFGIRVLSLNSAQGLQINGASIKLRGACVHHDNGIIGACAFEYAEERKCLQLKEAGFNCIRSSHNPISKAMLNACDKHGMLVIDELTDMWTRSKNNNDGARYFLDQWEYMTEQMVRKDMNHPSVIIYSTGNEIQESGTSTGVEINRSIVNKIRSLDDSRYTTCAINGTIAVLNRLDEIVSDVKSSLAIQRDSIQTSEQKESKGADALNELMSMAIGEIADGIATHPILTEQLDEFVDCTDIAGYNYMTGRHEMEHQIRPNRVVLGTESFPTDIARIWEIVKNNNHVIGDMTWTGYDYIGEAGIGYSFYDGRRAFTPNWPCRLAAVGDINLIGERRPISYYREIVFGLREKPYIAVHRMNRTGQRPNRTAWSWDDVISSWNWIGYEGELSLVDVYSCAEEVELFLNNKSIERKAVGTERAYIATFQLPFCSGKLRAVSYMHGEMTGEASLVTASGRYELFAEPDKPKIVPDGMDLSYIKIGIRDEYGNLADHLKSEIRISVSGAGTMEGFGSADPDSLYSFDSDKCELYDGCALAVIRAGTISGEIAVTIDADGFESKMCIIKVEEK